MTARRIVDLAILAAIALNAAMAWQNLRLTQDNAAIQRALDESWRQIVERQQAKIDECIGKESGR